MEYYTLTVKTTFINICLSIFKTPLILFQLSLLFHIYMLCYIYELYVSLDPAKLSDKFPWEDFVTSMVTKQKMSKQKFVMYYSVLIVASKFMKKISSDFSKKEIL